LGSSFIAYSESWVVPGEVLATVLIVFLVVLSVRRADVRTERMMLRIPACIAILAVIPAVLWVASIKSEAAFTGHVPHGRAGEPGGSEGDHAARQDGHDAYYSHSSKKAKRAAVENYAQRIPPEPVRVSKSTQERKA